MPGHTLSLLMARSFCATGTMGLLRDLTAGEITEQVVHVQKDASVRVTDVVPAPDDPVTAMMGCFTDISFSGDDEFSGCASRLHEQRALIEQR